MKSTDLELLPLWRRCIEHALVNFGDTMPAELRLWFAEQLMHDGPPVTYGNRHARGLNDMSEVSCAYSLSPNYQGEVWPYGVEHYSSRYNIT